MIAMNANRRRIVNHRLRARLLPQEEAVTVEGQDERYYHYAGFWVRLWAFLLDLIVIFSIKEIAIYSIFTFLNINNLYANFMIDGLVFFLYFALMTKFNDGQTVGKIVCGVKVVSDSEKPLTWGQVFFREGVGRLLHQAFFFLYLLYLVVPFTSKKEGLHDMIANTNVVHVSLYREMSDRI